MALRDDFNNIVGPVNELGATIDVHAEHWADYPTALKTIIKAETLAILNQAKDTDIPALIATITAL